MNKDHINVTILGGGPAGYVCAIRAAQLGANVSLIEKDALGGVCMNLGCIPTKALLKSAETVTAVKRSKEFGVLSSLNDIQWGAAVNYKDRVVKNLGMGLGQLIKARNINVIKGFGTVIDAKTISVINSDGENYVTTDNMVITTGASPFIPPLKGIGLEGVLTSDDLLSLNELPQSIVILGGGVIGVEFATMLNSADVKVTIIEMQDRILPTEDSEISTELLKIMKRKGITVKLSAAVTEIIKEDGGLNVVYTSKDKEYTARCEKILVAVGRKLNTNSFSALGLDLKDGHVVVDEHMETSVDGVYAAGDIVGEKLLAHLAFMEGKVAAENIMGLKTSVNYHTIPSCVYTSPEIASVGLTEEQAVLKGIPVKVGHSAFRHNGRAQTLGEREGYVKIVTSPKGVILGGQIIGPNATELISELTLAIALEATAGILADLCHPHPSLSEAIGEACGNIMGRPIHQI